MAKKQSSTTSTRNKETTSTAQYDAILAAADKLKMAIEEKNAKTLQSILGNSPIWIASKPGNVSTLVSSLTTLTGNATDLELSITKILATELDGNDATISLECQLVWSNTDTWEEHEASFDLHLGLTWDGTAWNFTHLGVLPTRIAAPGHSHIDLPSIDVPYFESATQFYAMQTAPYFSSNLHVNAPYFSAGAMENPMVGYFQDSGIGHFTASQATTFATDDGTHRSLAEHKDEPHDYVPVYMPIFVPASLFRHGRK